MLERIEYLGYIVGEGEIKINDEKIRAIKFYPQPKSKKQVQQYIGLVSYFRRFIKHFATICSPLTRLLKKDTTFKWENVEVNAFETLKNYLINEPILTLPRNDLDFVETTDASKIGFGATLSQIHEDKKEKIIAYGSRVTNDV